MSGCATSLDVLERLIGVSTKPGATAFTQMPEVADVAMTMFIHVFFRPGGNKRPESARPRGFSRRNSTNLAMQTTETIY